MTPLSRWRAALVDWLALLQTFAWRAAARTLRTRFREDRLGACAGSLTFTTLISLVPLFTVVLAVFSAFPMFGKLQGSLQQWLTESLIPDAIARQVLGYLTQFSSRASRLGALGIAGLLVTAASLVLTIDRSLNDVWRVRRPRPLARRIMTYWALLTLGPLLFAGSLTISGYLLSVSRGLVGSLPASLGFVLDLLQFALVTAGFTALYRFVPNTLVKWPHALVGGLLVALGLELAKLLLAWYLAKVPSYSAIYGAFASVPILLLWIYLVWLLVLAGAVVVAYWPSLLENRSRRSDDPGWRFVLALDILRTLEAQRAGCDLPTLALDLRAQELQVEEAMQALLLLGWVGRLEDARHVLLVDADRTALMPLVQALLLARTPATEFLWQIGRLCSCSLREALSNKEQSAA